MEPTMRSANTMPLWLPALMAGLLLAASSCSRPPSFDEERGSAPVVLDTLSPQAADQAATELAKSVLEGVRAYKLQPGDVIDVLFLADHRTAVSDYKIGIGDELELVFPFQPDANHTYVVRPDGRIALPQRGELLVIGKRPADLSRRIGELYSEIYVQPSVTVNVRNFKTDADDFIRMISGTDGPHSQSLTVSPSGEVNLPGTRSVKASGLTIDQLAPIVASLYRERFGSIEANVRLASSSAQQVFVFGEVQRPGPQPAARARTLLQLVGAAGGPTEFAALNAVRVLYWDEVGVAHIRQANVEKILANFSIEQDMAVPANSVVYVPPTYLAQAGRYVDQILRRLFLFQGFTAGFQYNLGTVGTRAQP
jgi:protein involved in polysaccharide export with SLBB domain